MTNKINDTVIMRTAANRTTQPPFLPMKLVQKLCFIINKVDSSKRMFGPINYVVIVMKN